MAHEAVRRGVRRLLVLDLAAVGRGGGPVHLEMLRRLRSELPAVELLAGGGVRSRVDIAALGGAGASGILIASALHDGSLARGDLEAPSIS